MGEPTRLALLSGPCGKWWSPKGRYAGPAVCSTDSPYLSLRSPARRGLCSELWAMIDDQFGGVVTRHYLAILAIARRL
jgi:hypothetical protein